MQDLNPAPQQGKKPMSTGKIVLIVLLCLCCCGGVPIIGILAAVAIPAYQDHTIRMKIADIQSALRTEQTNLETQFNSAKDCDRTPSISNQNIQSVSFSPISNQSSGAIEGCQITTTFNPATLSVIKNTQLIYTLSANQDGTTEWRCSLSGSPSQFRYFSSDCRYPAE